MKIGDYETGRIYCEDCLEAMKKMPDKCVDIVITDPPYGIKRDKGFGGFGGFGKPIIRRRYEDDDWDSIRPSKETFLEVLRISKRTIIFGGNFFTDLLPVGNHWICWDKLNTMPSFGDCELAWTNIKRNSVKKVTCEYNGLIGKEETRSHPTQKPLSLMTWIVNNYTVETDIICDPFSGSGTTLVAAKELGREFLGFEISQKYCEIAEKRLSQEILFK